MTTAVAEVPTAGRRSGSWWPTAAVLAGYGALALWLTWSWWTPLGLRITTVNPTDATLFGWLFTATEESLAGGGFPLFSDRMNAPDGINLMWNNGMVLPGVLFAPVTAVFGGLGTVTVVTTLGLAGTAGAVFGCLRSLSVRVLPAAMGGALAGFSPAMTAQAVGGHPNLVFDVLAPVLLLLAVRLMTDDDPPRRIAVLLGAVAGVQVLIGEEVLFLSGVVVAVLLLVLVVSRPRVARRRVRVFGSRAAVAFGVFLLVGGLPLGFQLFGPLRQEGSPFLTADYATDLANLVVPTRRQAVAPDPAVAVSGAFPGGPEEHTAYLGWPLLLLCAVLLVLRWRTLPVRVPLLVAAVVAVLGLGQELTMLGEGSGVALPGRLLAGLPGFEHVIVTRYPLFTAMLIGAALAFALEEAADRPPAVRCATWVAVLIAALPLVPAPLPGVDAPPVPEFFTGGSVPTCPGGSLLVLPFPRGEAPQAMLWQQAAGLSFAMPGGYFIAPGSDGRAYLHGRPTATGSLFEDVRRDGQVPRVTARMRIGFAADLARWRTCAVVLGPGGNTGPLRELATALLRAEPEAVDDVLLWRTVAAPP